MPNAAATATALEPDDAVSPAPRSQTRASITPSADRAARPGRSCAAGSARAPRAAGRCAGSSAGSPSTTACGLPTSTAMNAMPVDLLRRADVTSPRSCSTRPSSSIRARTSRGPTRTVTSLGARLLGEPARGDPRAVPRHLGARAVGVPDRDLDPVVAATRNTSRMPSASPTSARTSSGVSGSLSDQVDVPLRVPARRSHRRSPPRIESASSVTTPGIRRSHFRW